MILGSLQTLHLFPYYQTREQYETQTGKTCPPFDNTLPMKAWEDIGAGKLIADDDGNVTYSSVAIGVDGTPKLKSGKPYYKTFTCPQAFATRVNIPPKAVGLQPDVVSPFISDMPMPMRPLADDEELVPDLFAKVVVRKKGAPSPVVAPGGGAVDLGPVLAKLDELSDKVDFLTAAIAAKG